MVPLDSPTWGTLRHCYGAASDIPALLSRAATAPAQRDFREEPWFTLWSSLCHQGDVFEASYAAVPHLVAFAAVRAPGERADLLLLVASIEAARKREHGPPLAAAVRDEYLEAVARAAALAREALIGGISETTFQILAGCCAICLGLHSLGSAILELSRDLACPSCDAVFVPPGFDEFTGEAR